MIHGSGGNSAVVQLQDACASKINDVARGNICEAENKMRLGLVRGGVGLLHQLSQASTPSGSGSFECEMSGT
jgi:hypothetical protein